MIDCSKLTNELKAEVEDHKRSRKSEKSIDIESLNFPSLTEDYIRGLTFGVYQAKQAKLYTKEHLDIEGKYEFHFVPLQKNLIKFTPRITTNI